MSNAEKNLAIIDRYEELYFRRNNKPVTVHRTSPGWYTLLGEGSSPEHSFTRYRLSEISTMSDRMEITVAELEAAAERKGFVVFIIPPRGEMHANMKNYYLTEDDGWYTDRTDSSVKVFELASVASDVVNDINRKFPFRYAALEPF